MTARVAVVMSGFPRTSETFALGELVGLARAGRLVRVYATKPGDGAAPQPGAAELAPLVRMLPAGDAATQGAALAEDLIRDLTRDLEAGVDGIHGYFAHRPAEVAAAAAGALGLGFSFSTHALDARKVPAATLADRARAAVGVVACNTDVAQHVNVPGARVSLLPHGVDLARFAPRPRPGGDGTLRLLAVGRLVEKKGFPTLLDAAARLALPWRLRIVGTGAGRGQLEEAVDRLGLAGAVQLAGRRSHEQLPDDYAWADVVVVPSVVDATGDRDGLPNVALEAMAAGRPLVVSDVSALGGAVRDAGAGLVVPPGDPAALAEAIGALRDPRLRAQLAAAGSRHVRRHFDLATCTRRLVEHLDLLHARAPEAVDA